MNNFELDRQVKRIRGLISKASGAFGGDFEMQSQWAKYICVLTAGLLENAIDQLYSDYAKKQVSAPVARFVQLHLSKISNPRADKFLDIAGAFKESMRTDLSVFMQDQGRDDAINSIMNNRHQIAHGKERNVGLSLAQMINYFDRAVEVLEFIENQCNT